MHVEGGPGNVVTAVGTAVRRRRGARKGADGQTIEASDFCDIFCMSAEKQQTYAESQCGKCARQLDESSQFARHAKTGPTTSVIGRFSASRHLSYQNPPSTSYDLSPLTLDAISSTETHESSCHVASSLPLQRPGDSGPCYRRWLPHPDQVLLEPTPADRPTGRLPRPDRIQDGQGPESF